MIRKLLEVMTEGLSPQAIVLCLVEQGLEDEEAVNELNAALWDQQVAFNDDLRIVLYI